MVSLRKMLSEKTLSIEDLSYLSRLLESGLAIRDCFSLLKNKSNSVMRR